MVEQHGDEETNLLEEMFFGGGGGGSEGPRISSSPSPQEISAFDDTQMPAKASQAAAAGRGSGSTYVDDDDDDGDEDSEGECYPNGDVAICDQCQKVLPLSKFEKHVSYLCKKQRAECPLCFLTFVSGEMPAHLAQCQYEMRDPELVTCKYCQQRMIKTELADHAIAHIVEQKQVER